MRKKISIPDKDTSLKLSLTTLASGAIWFYTGPAASVAAREIFTLSYDVLYGIPNWYNPSYGLAYMPIREHVANYAFEYGGLMLGALCAPFIYKGIDAVSNMGDKILTTLGITPPEKTLIHAPIQEIPPLQFSKIKNRKSLILDNSISEINEKKLKRLSKDPETMLLKHKRLSTDPESLLANAKRSSQDYTHLINSAPTRFGI